MSAVVGPYDVPEPDDNLRFWTLDYEGKGVVHVHQMFVRGADVGRIDSPFNPWMRARCGLLALEQKATTMSSFADDRLCRRCWAATPEGEQGGLFEHERD